MIKEVYILYSFANLIACRTPKSNMILVESKINN